MRNHIRTAIGVGGIVENRVAKKDDVILSLSHASNTRDLAASARLNLALFCWWARTRHEPA
jgi:hypothetical protein